MLDIKNHIKNNFLIYTYLFMQIFILVFANINDKIIGNRYNFSTALVYHLFMIFFVLIGYIPKNPNFISRPNNYTSEAIFNKKFITLSFFLTILGIVTSIATVSAIVSPSEYLNKLIAGDNMSDIRTETGNGGLSGFLKMLNYLPLSVYLITTSFKNAFIVAEKQKKLINQLQNFSFVGAIIKVFFSLDRLTILAILIAQIYEKVLVRKFNYKLLLLVPLILFILGVVTSSRMSDSSIIEFLATYSKLSLINFQLNIDHFSNWTYGWNTFLAPLTNILRFFNVNKEVAQPQNWVWNPAQYFNSYLYMDFGIFSFLFQFLIGVFMRKIQINVFNKKPISVAVYIIIVFAVSSFFSVPFVRGVEFWVMLFTAFLLSKNVKVTTTNC